MHRPAADFERRQVRQPSSRKTLTRGANGVIMLLLAGALVALAGTPANLQEALQAQRALVAENPTDAHLLNDLGNLLALAGNLEEAEEIYRRALGVDPGDVTALYNLALVLREQDQSKEAAKILRSILDLDPQHAWAHYQLGTLFAEQGNRTKAVHHYAEAFSLDRSLTSPKVNPHIVENQLATDALLKMHVHVSPSTQAPRIYQEPGNVADLLLPKQVTEPRAEPTTESAPEATTEQDEDRRPGSDASPAADPESAMDDADEWDDDWQEEELDAQTEPATPRRIDASTIEMQQTRRTKAAGDASQTNAGRATSPSSPRSSSSDQPAPSGDLSTSDGDPVGSGTSFLPGVQSTGRLDIELLPAAEPAPATSPT